MKILYIYRNQSLGFSIAKVFRPIEEEMRKYAVLLGMSAEGKLKLKGAKVGKEEDKVLSEFGDI